MTKTIHPGDEGVTRNYLGHPQPKSNQSIETIGTIDELCAHLGLIKFIAKQPEKYHINRIQLQLMSFMSIVSGYKENKSFITTERLDYLIQKYEQISPTPKNFVLPGEKEVPTFINITRTICRRAERQAVTLNADKNILKFLNRLSNYLFALQNYYSQ